MTGMTNIAKPTEAMRERVRDFVYDCTKDEFSVGWTLSAHQTDDLIAMVRLSAPQEPDEQRCGFCNYPLPAHSDICVAWHSQRGMDPPTKTVAQEPVADDDALIELCARLRMKAKEVVLEETNSWSLAKAANEAADAIERLQAKAPERGEPQ